MTKGTFKENLEVKSEEKREKTVDNKYLMAVRQSGEEVGAVLLECSTD